MLVGQPAKNQRVTNVDRTIRSVKREMPMIGPWRSNTSKYTPQEISARTLMKLKQQYGTRTRRCSGEDPVAA